MPTFKLTIPRRGLAEGKTKITVESEGFNGTACIASTAKILKQLGQVVHTADTPDMYKDAQQNVQATN